MHPFAYVMIATFIAVVVVLTMGITSIGRHSDKAQKSRSSRLMLLRVMLSFALLIEIVIYVAYFK